MWQFDKCQRTKDEPNLIFQLIYFLNVFSISAGLVQTRIMSFLGKFFESASKSLLSSESFILSEFSFHATTSTWTLKLFLLLCYFFCFNKDQIRGKKKKASGSTRNKPIRTRPKHRGWKVQDGHYVSENTLLVTQRHLRFHPGLNVCVI